MDRTLPPLRIGLAGLGTVGAGVVKVLQTHGPRLDARAGRPLELAAVSARHRAKDRGVDVSGYAWEDDPVALARREDVDLVVEVIGGEDGPAKAVAEAALARGAGVVTANKALMARHGAALAARAEETGAALRYEAGVAGGIPIVKALGEGLAANALRRVAGVLNGTCNYILTEMERTGRDYGDILAEAQRKGYAEADPEADVGGWDAAHKLSLLAALGFGALVDFDAVRVEGIGSVSLADIRFAREMGYRIKLLGIAHLTEQGLEQRVAPCLVPAESAVGVLDGVTNAVVCEGDFVGACVFEGPGAGEGPTASAIVADVIDVARGGRRPAFGQPVAELRSLPPLQVDAITAPFYLRLPLDDRPGALAQVAQELGGADVSIARMRQLGRTPDPAEVIIVTHDCVEARLREAIDRIAALDVCRGAPAAFRIEAAAA